MLVIITVSQYCLVVRGRHIQTAYAHFTISASKKQNIKQCHVIIQTAYAHFTVSASNKQNIEQCTYIDDLRPPNRQCFKQTKYKTSHN